MDVLAAIRRRHGVPSASVSEVVTGLLVSAPVDGVCVVSVRGSAPIAGVPAVAGDWDGVTTVRVLLVDGRPVQVLGAIGATEVGAGVGDTPPPPLVADEPASQTQTITRTIMPSVSGTWRVPRAAWGRWGAAPDTYQASSGASGQLWGLACYGSQVTGIGASEITAASVSLVQVGTGMSGVWSAVVRGSASGSLPSSAPMFTGESVSVDMPGRSQAGAVRTVALSASMREGLRTGAIGSLGLVGGSYGAAAGLGSHAQAWVLRLTCTVPA